MNNYICLSIVDVLLPRLNYNSAHRLLFQAKFPMSVEVMGLGQSSLPPFLYIITPMQPHVHPIHVTLFLASLVTYTCVVSPAR